MIITSVLRRTIAAVLLILMSPFLIIIWFTIKFTDPSLPAFFQQIRIGYQGRPYAIWKMRSMNTVSSIEPVTSDDDPRITPIGRFIRRSHLDELIQILNVTNGTMKFIGPRSKLQHESKEATATVPGWERRHDELPGITGLKQVFGRTDDYRVEAVFDRLWRMRRKSVCFRLWIIYKTAIRVLGMGGQ
tara:strand:- start:1548 stop:2111 length:564 start_codon:yes stop_codon:yes gene_type:complete